MEVIILIMIRVTFINSSPYIGLAFHQIEDSLICFVLETNDRDESHRWTDNLFERLMKEASALLSPELPIRNIPADMASAIQQTLLHWNSIGALPSTVMYTGLVVLRSEIHITRAGGCRVHLVRNNELVSSTIDHNLVNYPPDDFVERQIAEHESARWVAQHSVSHVLGAYGEESLPENEIWKVDGNFQLLICSEKFHSYEDPHRYFLDYLQEDFSRFAAESFPQGLIVKITAFDS